jgi:hypothetical protein
MSHELPRTVRTILIGASQIIRTRGWCRGKLLDERGAVCLLGAIFEAGTGRSAAMFYGGHEQCDEVTNAAWEIVEDLINARFGEIGESRLAVPGWNDQPSRTVEDVLKILDDAVAIA